MAWTPILVGVLIVFSLTLIYLFMLVNTLKRLLELKEDANVKLKNNSKKLEEKIQTLLFKQRQAEQPLMVHEKIVSKISSSNSYKVSSTPTKSSSNYTSHTSSQAASFDSDYSSSSSCSDSSSSSSCD